MQGIKRRVVYAVCYEAIAIALSSVVMAWVTNQPLAHAGGIAVVASLMALVWNMVFNWLFERWESRQATRGRGLGRRVAHAIGFEGGLALMLVPLFAWWFGMTWMEALWMDIGLLLFFLVYTFVYNWGFDRIFGLPAAAA